MRKGFVFTMDAMIALSVMIMIILTVAFVKFETILPEKRYEKLNFMAEDTMSLIEYLEVHEIQDTPTIDDLIKKGELEKRDLKKSVLDLIASFWYKGNYSTAGNISKDVLEGLVEDVCLNLTVGNETIYSSCDTPADKIAVATRIESGYEPGKPGYGYVAAARLTDIRGKKDSSYSYFGGYVGEGNITKILVLPPYDEILEAYMEMNLNSNFTLYINGNYSGFFANGTAGGGNMTADKWIVCNETYYPEYCLNFTEGNNTLEFNFVRNDSYIGGGYFRVTYNTKQLAPERDPNKDRYWFPGIKGFLNLYSSFYIPGQLNNMTMRLHYFNNLIFEDYGVPIYVTIADKEVFRSDDIGEQDVNLSYDDIWPAFGINPTIFENYISNKTVPLTFGTDRFYLTGLGVADAVLITDVSGSMDECDVGTSKCLHPDCDGSSGCQNERLDVAKDVDIDFITDILKLKGNRAGLVAYSAEPGIRSYHDLTENKDVLIDQINSYIADGYTCISCGIDKAIEILSNPRVDKDLIEDKRFWLYNTSYPTTQPPDDGEGDSWNEIDYNDDWNNNLAILGFENTPYNPNVDIDIGNNFVLVSDDNYNPSSYFLVDASVTGGSLSDTYSVDGNTFDVFQEGTIWTTQESSQTQTCSCDFGGCSCEIPFNNFLNGGCTLDTASINVRARGDLNRGDEYITVYTDGTNMGDCCTDCGQCRSSYSNCNSYDVTSYASDDSLTVSCNASGEVNYCTPDMACQVNLTWTENCPIRNGEVWFNSSTISYSELPGSIKVMIKFLSTGVGDYQALIYNFNNNNWESTDCDGGSVEADAWNDYWCNRTWDVENYISDDNRIKVALNSSSNNQATIRTDFVQYYITVGSGNYYFRKHFNIDNVSAINYAGFYVLSDDRAEVYLNGYLIDNDTVNHQATYWNRPGIIFSDNFDGGLDLNKWTITQGSQGNEIVISDGCGYNSDPYTLIERWNPATVETMEIDISTSYFPKLSYWIRQGYDVGGGACENPEFGEDVIVEYLNSDLNWIILKTHPGEGYDPSTGSGRVYDFNLPSDASHGNFKIRFRYTGGDGSNYDYWAIDDVVLEASIPIDISYFVEGDNVVAVKLYNDDSESAKFDLKLVANVNETREKAMLVMSDGLANRCIPGVWCNQDDAKTEAINKACEARDYGIAVYAVAFGSSVDNETLIRIACWNCSSCDPSMSEPWPQYCWLEGESLQDCSHYFASEDNTAEELEEIYRKVAEEIVELGYAAQKVNITGAINLENILYTDSFIEYNFTPSFELDEDTHGKVSITREGQRLRELSGDNLITDPVTETKEGEYNISGGVTVVDAKMTSYSSEYWTDRLFIDSSATGGWTSVYNLSKYSWDYRSLGDPYIIQIPVDYIGTGENSLRIGTGYYNGTDILGIGGSPDDRLIYTMRVRGQVGYNQTFKSLDEATEDAQRRLNDTIKVYGIYVDDDDIDVDYKSYGGIRSIWGPSLLKIIMWENTTI